MWLVLAISAQIHHPGTFGILYLAG